MSDLISRQAAIDAIRRLPNAGIRWFVSAEAVFYVLLNLPSAEITDEQAILHLQSTGWMQNHDREMYESLLREQLADDSASYDSLIPCEDAITRAVGRER